MTAIREKCACECEIHVKHPDPAPIAAQWRSTHPCDRRTSTEREVTGSATVETAYTEPHRTDSQVRRPLGFATPNLSGVEGEDE